MSLSALASTYNSGDLLSIEYKLTANGRFWVSVEEAIIETEPLSSLDMLENELTTADLWKNRLPDESDLPDSDDIPVDNEDQNWIPNVLLMLLKSIWIDRADWFFGVDMAIYHITGGNARVPVVPDGFLSLGVERRKNNKSRRSYVTWKEQDVVPCLVLEIVSWTPGGEYDEKMAIYAKLGVLYYVIYNPEFWQRDGHHPFEVYKLVDNSYCLQIGEPLWMPEVGLGIGRCPEIFGATGEEVLSWFDDRGSRYLRSEERAAKLAEKLRELGVDPDSIG